MNDMRNIIVTLVLYLLAASSVSADYSLPPVKERLVLLLDLNDVKLDEHDLVLILDKSAHTFTVDRFWMQDRIWSDGICVGVQDSDPKSSASRIREVQLALATEKDSLLLVELVCVEDTNHFIVTYLKQFDPAMEYNRYFPKQTFYDTIKMPFVARPEDSESFVNELREITKKSEEKIKKL